MACVAGGTIRADVAVLGAGLAGLSAAIGFARRGRRVCVLERDATEREPASRISSSTGGSGPESRTSASRTTS